MYLSSAVLISCFLFDTFYSSGATTRYVLQRKSYFLSWMQVTSSTQQRQPHTNANAPLCLRVVSTQHLSEHWRFSAIGFLGFEFVRHVYVD